MVPAIKTIFFERSVTAVACATAETQQIAQEKVKIQAGKQALIRKARAVGRMRARMSRSLDFGNSRFRVHANDALRKRCASASERFVDNPHER